MKDFSLHILDICENSITAGARLIKILISEDTSTDRLTIEVEDDGRGMPEEFRRRVLNPFVTTRIERRVGLGLPLLAQAAQMTDGDIDIASAPDKGTKVRAGFKRSHIDLKPLGDMAATLVTLIAGHPELDFFYLHRVDDKEFIFDTAEIRAELGDLPLNHPTVLNWIRDEVRENLVRLAK